MTALNEQFKRFDQFRFDNPIDHDQLFKQKSVIFYTQVVFNSTSMDLSRVLF